MHLEDYTVPEATAAAVMKAKREGRPILAVGTTSVRTLESAWVEDAGGAGALRSGPGSTRIFMYPGYRFKVVDRLFTNFHTPKSTLLMLVSAFAGRERILDAYAEAVRLRYRFFSYGDAMLIL
jgi:S-adenosylmethionine:tRNA ribosyltransferase-isomerase